MCERTKPTLEVHKWVSTQSAGQREHKIESELYLSVFSIVIFVHKIRNQITVQAHDPIFWFGLISEKQKS